MRIAMVSEHASPLAEPGGPDSGGQNVHVRELSLALAARGHDVTVLTRRDDPGLPEVVPLGPGVRVRHVTAGPATRIPKDAIAEHVPRLSAELYRIWAAEPPDLVHAHFWMSGTAAAGPCAELGLPLAQTFHALGHVKRREQGAQDTSPEGRIEAERGLAAGVDRVIATCQDEVFELLRMGAQRTRTSIVPCGVDVAEFTPEGPADSDPGTDGRSPQMPTAGRSPQVPTDGRSPQMLTDGRSPRILTVGRLVRRKGIDEVVEALTRVPGVELLVAGGPPAGTDPATDPDMTRLREAAARAGVTSRVRLLGAVPRAAMPALLRSADVVVCAPWYEPFGIVPLEAMACGRPVVASAVGGMKDTVVHGVTGLHVPPRRPDLLGDALRELLADPEARAAFGAEGRRRAVARYAWPRVAAGTEAAYLATLRGMRGEAPIRARAGR